jgi:hypothetical protein
VVVPRLLLKSHQNQCKQNTARPLSKTRLHRLVIGINYRYLHKMHPLQLLVKMVHGLQLNHVVADGRRRSQTGRWGVEGGGGKEVKEEGSNCPFLLAWRVVRSLLISACLPCLLPPAATGWRLPLSLLFLSTFIALLLSIRLGWYYRHRYLPILLSCMTQVHMASRASPHHREKGGMEWRRLLYRKCSGEGRRYINLLFLYRFAERLRDTALPAAWPAIASLLPT